MLGTVLELKIVDFTFFSFFNFILYFILFFGFRVRG